MSMGEMRGDVAAVFRSGLVGQTPPEAASLPACNLSSADNLLLSIEPLTSSHSLLTDHTQSHLNHDGPVKAEGPAAVALGPGHRSGPSSQQQQPLPSLFKAQCPTDGRYQSLYRIIV